MARPALPAPPAWILRVLASPGGPAGQLGQEEVVEEKVQESFQARKVFQPEGGAAAPRAEQGGCQGSARKGPETEPTAAVRPPQALLPE